jgi:hypothetical protein
VKGTGPIVLSIVVLLVAFAYGPLVPGFGLADPQSASYEPATGNVDVSVVDLPDMLTLERTTFGASTFVLESNMASVNVSNVEGNPLVVYDLFVPELEYNRQAYRILSPDVDGVLTLTQDSASIQPYRVNDTTYNATITILVRSDVGKRVLTEKNVTIRVGQ